MTTEGRTARLADEIGHMATKADIEAVRGEIDGMRGEIGKLSATLTRRMILVARATQALGIRVLLQFLPRA